MYLFIFVTTSDIKISAVIEREKLGEAARALHTEFGLDREASVLKGKNR
jgi:aspartokinase